MDQQATHGVGGAAYSLLRHQTISTALSLPHHAIFLGDCADPRSDGLDDETSSSLDSNSNGNNFYYSKPIMVLDLIWNLAFVAVSVAVLFSASRERPSTPLRVWVSGYSLQCLLHVGFVYFPYQKRMRTDHDNGDGGSVSNEGLPYLQTHSRLTVVFLAFDVFFIIFCIGMACIIFFAVFCCIPIIAIAYAVAIRRGASEDDISSLPKYRYCRDNQLRPLDNDKKREFLEERLGSSNTSSANELALLPEDSGVILCYDNPSPEYIVDLQKLLVHQITSWLALADLLKLTERCRLRRTFYRGSIPASQL
ncbi:E3 ubiquitin-protein ligase At4g11680 isoform X10 [Hevea brasiliensis]|uniref:E3 ubiquitin-protein ligase At4g11680 isoform X10 n=1 Tax=Hevea brasiliensis TaxID=3981 RepID=UPI0025E979B7|nr:E3 ubiquitin-protein ligase At4g11680 isoform X10 [Hevea brasiliensis]